MGLEGACEGDSLVEGQGGEAEKETATGHCSQGHVSALHLGFGSIHAAKIVE